MARINQKIKVGNTEGKHFSQEKWDHVMVPLAESLVVAFPLTNPVLFYDATADYIHFQFDLDGDHYDIQHYKVFSVAKNKQSKIEERKYFGRDPDRVVVFFDGGLHKGWKV